MTFVYKVVRYDKKQPLPQGRGSYPNLRAINQFTGRACPLIGGRFKQRASVAQIYYIAFNANDEIAGVAFVEQKKSLTLFISILFVQAKKELGRQL